MITTQSATQSTTTKRRGSVHTNLYDSQQFPMLKLSRSFVGSGLSDDGFAENLLEKTDERQSPPEKGLELREKLVALFPPHVKEYLPEINVRVTGLCCLWYVTSSVSSNLSKAILSGFPHPVALTELQFSISAALCFLFVTMANMLSSERAKKTNLSRAVLRFPEGILPTYLNGSFTDCILHRFLFPCKMGLTATFPMGIFQLVGHITSHKATFLIPVSLVHSVKALSPIMTVAYFRIAKGRQYSPMTYYTLIPLVFGVIITCWSTHGHKSPSSALSKDSSFMFGLFFALISMAIFVSQNIFAKGILTVKKSTGILPSKAGQKKSSLDERELSPLQIDKITILFYCSCIGFLLTFPLFISNELLNLRGDKSVFHDLNSHVILLATIHGIAHFFQAMLAFQLIGMLSPVTYSIANIMKRIVIIGVALVWESSLSYGQIFGLAMTVTGLYGYDKWGMLTK
ncbi:LAMI_0C09560g1_1 [Lachancea mirantina]|uniref:LAMI_0C09560g1_1 n=1 Tax=Lachancea mirantina TaxID=1230905 RepID=A0A1G4J5T6_9SACH|nr:LAMI_0C09560g1_1 [Lachancea mirantina]